MNRCIGLRNLRGGKWRSDESDESDKSEGRIIGWHNYTAQSDSSDIPTSDFSEKTMKQSTQKYIAVFLIAFVVFGGFEALIYILNLNQPVIYWQTAFWIFLYLLFNIVFFFDLHFKILGSWQRAKIKHQSLARGLGRFTKTVFSALGDRFGHLRRWEYLRQWIYFLLLPGFIFWASVSLFYVNFGFFRSQQIVAVFSGIALVAYYSYLKEIFNRKKEVVDSDIFIVLSVIKIYTAGALFAAAMSMLRSYCLQPWYFSAEVFCFTFLLIYQALYQHRKTNAGTTFQTLIISLLMAIIGQLVYVYWGYNYFTAAVFLTACYNFFWGVFHYHLDKSLTWRAFWEILIISLIMALMVLSVTNFNAKLLDSCRYAVF